MKKIEALKIVTACSASGVKFYALKENAYSISEVNVATCDKKLFALDCIRIVGAAYQIIFSSAGDRNSLSIVLTIESDYSLRAIADIIDSRLFSIAIEKRYINHANGLWDEFIREFIAGPYTNVRGRIHTCWAATSIYGSR